MRAARAQLHTAIKLWFEGGDPVAIHTLASAAHEIVHALYRNKGLKGLVFDSPKVFPEYQQKWASSLKKPFNFFKHGRNEPSDASIELETVWTQMMIAACCKGISSMGLPVAGQELAFTWWLFFADQRLFVRNQHLLQYPKVQFLQEVAAKGREAFFREFMAAYDSGDIVFTDRRSREIPF